MKDKGGRGAAFTSKLFIKRPPELHEPWAWCSSFWEPKAFCWPRFGHEATNDQPIISDQPTDNGDDAIGKTTQHAWARKSGSFATSYVCLGQDLQTAHGPQSRDGNR